jgi:hypothetical protein
MERERGPQIETIREMLREEDERVREEPSPAETQDDDTNDAEEDS